MWVLEYTRLKRFEETKLLKDILINTAVRLGVDDQLRRLFAPFDYGLRRDRIDNQNLRLLLTSALTEDANCIDIGAHKGGVLAEMVRVAPCGKHIAYEPLPFLHKYLVDHFPTVDVRLAAASNEEGETCFTYVKNLPTMSGFRERSYYPMRPQFENMTVRTETLDGSLPAGYIPALIKIDVEGAERLVIEGAIQTISKYRPIVVFECGMGSSDRYGTKPCQIYQLLHDEPGLHIFDLDGNGPYTLGQFEESFARCDRWNYVARP
jgi:FkbM family methyltransferase